MSPSHFVNNVFIKDFLEESYSVSNIETAKFVWTEVVKFPFKLNFPNVFLPIFFAGKGALYKDPTVWLDGARPANTCLPPSL